MKSESVPLSAATRWLHGIVAVGVISMLAYGFVMEQLEFDGAVLLHISCGLTLLLVIAVRAVRRLQIGWPQANPDHPLAQRRTARAVQWLLLPASLGPPNMATQPSRSSLIDWSREKASEDAWAKRLKRR